MQICFHVESNSGKRIGFWPLTFCFSCSDVWRSTEEQVKDWGGTRGSLSRSPVLLGDSRFSYQIIVCTIEAMLQGTLWFIITLSVQSNYHRSSEEEETTSVCKIPLDGYRVLISVSTPLPSTYLFYSWCSVTL